MFFINPKVCLILFLGLGLTGVQAQTDTTTGTVADIDGNVYKVVTIGNQVWMAENLRTTRYRNGDTISTTNPATLDISNEIEPKYQWAYDGDDRNVPTYGRLYTWFAVTDKRNIAPVGWHVPTDVEWKILGRLFGGDSIAIDNSKQAGTMYWKIPKTTVTNESGFVALSAGSRWPNGKFVQLGKYGHYWAANEEYPGWAWRMLNNYEGENTIHMGSAPPKIGWAVRCIKDIAK
jgi:uncharacterized protein (TIGR02145 family)